MRKFEIFRNYCSLLIKNGRQEGCAYPHAKQADNRSTTYIKQLVIVNYPLLTVIPQYHNLITQQRSVVSRCFIVTSSSEVKYYVSKGMQLIAVRQLVTGLPEYSDSAGTLKKCRCKMGASYCVTVTGVTVSGEPCTVHCDSWPASNQNEELFIKVHKTIR